MGGFSPTAAPASPMAMNMRPLPGAYSQPLMPDAPGAGVFSGQQSPVPSHHGLSPQRASPRANLPQSPREDESERSSGGSPGRREHEGSSEAVRVLERQVDRLHMDLEREQKSHSIALQSVQAKVARLEQENAQLAQELARVRQRETAREAEAMTLRREVVDKAAELDRVCRDATQQQAAAMAKLQSVAQAMQGQVQQLEARANAAKQDALQDAQLLQPARAVERPDDLLQPMQPKSPLHGPAQGGDSPAALSPTLAPIPAPPAQGGDSDTSQWFLSMKANLQQFGDVEVFVEDTQRECLLCKEVMVSPYRVKPRKCPHIFHIECLLQCWEDGTCPCCRVSFAPESDGAVCPPVHRQSEHRDYRGERRRGDDGRSHVSVHSSISQRVPTASRSPGARRGHSLRAQHPL